MSGSSLPRDNSNNPTVKDAFNDNLTDVHVEGNLIVKNASNARLTNVKAKGNLIVEEGFKANLTKVSAGGILTINNGSKANLTEVSAGGILTINNGFEANLTKVSAGDILTINNGSKANLSDVEAGGILTINNGSEANLSDVKAKGNFILEDGANIEFGDLHVKGAFQLENVSKVVFRGEVNITRMIPCENCELTFAKENNAKKHVDVMDLKSGSQNFTFTGQCTIGQLIALSESKSLFGESVEIRQVTHPDGAPYSPIRSSGIRNRNFRGGTMSSSSVNIINGSMTTNNGVPLSEGQAAMIKEIMSQASRLVAEQINRQTG